MNAKARMAMEESFCVANKQKALSVSLVRLKNRNWRKGKGKN